MPTVTMSSIVRSMLRIGGAVGLVVLGLFIFVGAMTTMPGSSHRGPLPPLSTQERTLSASLRKHVTALASVEHNIRRYAQLETAATYLEAELMSYGYVVRREEFEVSGKMVRNLEVTISSKLAPGRNVVVVGGHYDSAQGSPGANDNGTGAAAVLELAKSLKSLGETSRTDVILVLYTNEEPPYFRTQQMGSSIHARALKARNVNVKAMLSLETMGYFSDEAGSQKYPWPLNQFYPGQGDFIGFVATTGDWRFVRQVVKSFRAHTSFPSEGIAAPRFVPGIDWSDHGAYIDEGFPALMVTDTAPYRYPYYHTTRDTPDKVDYDRLARVVTGLSHVLRDLVADE